MKKTGIILVCFLLGSILLFSQNSDRGNYQDKETEYFVGFDTGTTNNFNKILETLMRTEGIAVLSYCEHNNIIKLSFNRNNFEELASIFDLLEVQYKDVICYHMKHYTDKSYNKMCSDELIKRNMGGTE